MVRSRAFKLRESAILAVAIQVAFAPAAHAAPGGPAVVNGQVTITQPNPSTTQIQSSDGAIINWNRFSIGAGEITRFIEPSQSSAVLNRVTGGDASQILGQLQSNGRVFLINPNGIVIGVGARIDTNGFVASTLDVTDSDFLAGKLKFTAGVVAGSIDNQGLISVGPGGRIALIAPSIVNSGVIFAPGGELLLAAGRKISISSTDFEDVTFEVQAPTDSVINLGKLLADNGAIQVFAGSLQQSGVIRANGMVADASGEIRLVGTSAVNVAAGSLTEANGASGGRITIQSTAGTNEISGQVSATGARGTGGSVQLLGERVGVESGSTVNASGTSGGGEILVGGDLHGANAAVQDADMTYVGQGATLIADASATGNGGKVVVWANQDTRFLGTLSAQGGATGGNGGNAEVSGKAGLAFEGGANLGAGHGAAGALLLDPLDIIVSANGGILPSVVSQFTTFEGNVVTISPAGLNLVQGNVVLEAARNIQFDTPTNFTGKSLTVEAGLEFSSGSIALNQNLTTKGGAVDLTGYTVSGPGTISTSGGAVTIAVTGGLYYSSAISSGGGAVSLSTSAGSISSANVNAGSGKVTLTASAGSLQSNSVTGGVVSLTSSASQSDTVDATTRVDASSSGSSVSLQSPSGDPLRLGTIAGASGAYLSSNDGMQRVGSASITAPFVYLDGENGGATLGSSGVPLTIATSELELNQLGAAATIALSGRPTLSELYLSGSVAALGGTSITGAANLTSFGLSNGGGVVDLNIVASAGLGNGFTLAVGNGGIQSTTINVPAPVTLSAAGSAALGTVSSQSLAVTATGPISVTSATTSNGNLTFTSGSCQYTNASCGSASGISAGTLVAGGGGSVSLTSSDNGNISVGTLTAAGSANLTAGYYEDWSTTPRTSAITVGTATIGQEFEAVNYGAGALTVSGPVVAGSTATLAAGHGALSVQDVTSTNSEITLEASGDVSFHSLTASGASGSVVLESSSGSITTTQDSAAADIVSAGNVSLTATAGAIGNPAFTHPLVIQAGATSTVTLAAGSDVGASGKPVAVDTNGGIDVSSSAGQFFVVAENPAGTLQSVNTIELSASAAGLGAGGTSSFVSHDLSVNATSDGSTITIGNIDQSVNTLNLFSFTASGASSLNFGDVNLTTAGYNQAFLSSGGALTQLLPGTNNINAGNIGLAGGTSGTVTLGNVTSSVVAGNAISITGGDINALNLLGPSISVSGADVALGSVTSTGTLRGYYTGYAYVPYLGYSEYVTDQIQLTATGSVTTTGSITSATSVYGTAASGFSVAGGAGSITGGDSNPNYYTDTVNVAAGSGTLAATTITAFQVGVSGKNIDTSAITAQGSDLSVSGTDLVTGNLSAPNGSVTVSGTSFATGNITAGGSINLTASAAYQPGAIALSGGSSVTLTAPGGIDLTTNGATLTSPQVTLTATGGAVSANLTGTSTLAIEAGGAINVASSVALSTLDISAKGNLLGAASDITGTGQSFAMSTVGGTTASLDFSSPTPIQLSYTELAPVASVAAINLSTNFPTASNFQLNGSGAVINANSVVADSPITLGSTGDINLNSVNTEGNALSASSSAGNISVGTITTAGGDVTLIASSGSVLKSGGGAGMIDAGSSADPSGFVQIEAAHGSVGVAGAAITVSNTSSLDLVAANAITLDMNATTLTNLSIVTGASGSGAISIANNPNYAGFSLTRSGSNLELGAVTPTAAGAFSLVATNGNIVVNSDINVSALTLDAYNGGANPTGTLSIVAGAGARSVTVSGAAYLDAGGDVTIASGTAAGATVALSAGQLQSTTGGSFLVQASGASASVSASSESINASGSIEVLGGTSGTAASAALTASSSQYLSAGGNLLVQGGSASGASAAAQGGSYQQISVTGNFSVLGGSATGTSASVAAGSQYLVDIQGAAAIVGGSGKNAFASVVANAGYQYLGNQDTYYYSPTKSVVIEGGNGAGAYGLLSSASTQYVQTDGNISVVGGGGGGAYASVLSGAGQYIGSTYGYYSPATQSIEVRAGSGGIASMVAAGSQSVEGQGTISVVGGSASDMTASIVSTGGSQTIGDAQAGYAYFPTQKVVVDGGSGNGAAALISASSGQSVGAGVEIALTGAAAGASAEITNGSGLQTVGNLGAGYQQTQSITLNGGNGALSSAQITSAGSQNLNATGLISLNNATSDVVAVTTTGAQTIDAGKLAVSLSSSLSASMAEVSAGGAQTINLNDGSGTASLTVSNLSGAGGSLAQVKSTGNQTITMPYSTSAGPIDIGGTNTLGESLLYSGGVQTLLAGEIVIQGGATSAAAAKIISVGDSTMSAINGSVSVLAGALGPAAIDPPNLDLITDGAVTVIAGSAATATATITAGNINIGATNGDVTVTGGSVNGAAASIAANGTPGTLNMYSSGNLIIAPNAGGATVSAVAPTGNNIFLAGLCEGCDAGLIGVFNISSAGITNVAAAASTPTDPSMGDLSALLDYLADLYGQLNLADDGSQSVDLTSSDLQCR